MIQKAKENIIGKNELSDQITANLKKKKIELTKVEVKAVIDEILLEIKNSLVKGKNVSFIGYFTFSTREQGAREMEMTFGEQKGKKIKVPAKQVPKVKFADSLKKEVANEKKVEKAKNTKKR